MCVRECKRVPPSNCCEGGSVRLAWLAAKPVRHAAGGSSSLAASFSSRLAGCVELGPSDRAGRPLLPVRTGPMIRVCPDTTPEDQPACQPVATVASPADSTDTARAR
jgi:hypothetical protein